MCAYTVKTVARAVHHALTVKLLLTCCCRTVVAVFLLCGSCFHKPKCRRWEISSLRFVSCLRHETLRRDKSEIVDDVKLCCLNVFMGFRAEYRK